ncbi:MAG TPA: hypothetical protein PKJ33_00540 [Alphaproteobacteria bacterium]|mgnify:CR=1 FL=1|nr:hypothetical protein [Alphaproteobacteria bacterium]
MVKKIVDSTKSKLASWFFKEPVKFAFLSFGLIFGVSVIYLLARGIFGAGFGIPPLFFLTLVLVSLFFAAYKLISWLPKDKLDRHSFVAVDNGLSMIYFIVFVGFTLLIANSTQSLIFYAMWLQHSSMVLFFITAILGILGYLYVFGLLIANLYATYNRAVTMGVPKWKVLLSLPFTFTIFWATGYLLPEEKKSTPVIEIKTKWYARFTNWVVAKPINSLIVFLFTAIFFGLMFESYSTGLTIFLTAIFGIWLLFQGVSKFRKSIGGAFSTFVAVLNIVVVLGIIGYMTFQVSTQPIQIQQETVQVTTTKPTK